MIDLETILTLGAESVISESGIDYLDAGVLVPPLAASVLEHGHVDDLQHRRPLDLRHQELDQWPRYVVGHECAPTRNIPGLKASWRYP